MGGIVEHERAGAKRQHQVDQSERLDCKKSHNDCHDCGVRVRNVAEVEEQELR